MSSKIISIICGLSLLFVAGCEFRPALVSNPNQGNVINETEIEVTGNYKAEEFKDVLSAQFGKSPQNPKYKLFVNLEHNDDSGPIQGSGGFNRYEVLAKANGILIETQTGEVLVEFSISDRASWTSDAVRGVDPEKSKENASLGVGEVLNNLNARDDARFRLYKLLADRIYTRSLVVGNQNSS